MERQERKFRKIIPIGLILIVVSLFVPWVRWPEFPTYAAGSRLGLYTQYGWALIGLGGTATYLALKRKDILSSAVITAMSILMVMGSNLSLRQFAPTHIQQAVAANLFDIRVSVALGLRLAQIGSMLVFLGGLLSIIQHVRITRETAINPEIPNRKSR